MPRLARLARTLDQLSEIFPPLKRLIFEAFWVALALIEVVRFLRYLLENVTAP